MIPYVLVGLKDLETWKFESLAVKLRENLSFRDDGEKFVNNQVGYISAVSQN